MNEVAQDAGVLNDDDEEGAPAGSGPTITTRTMDTANKPIMWWVRSIDALVRTAWSGSGCEILQVFTLPRLWREKQ